MRAAGATVALVLLVVACGSDDGGDDLSGTWDVELTSVETTPPDAFAVDEATRSRTYEIDLGDCPSETTEGYEPVTDPDRCVGSADVEITQEVVEGVPLLETADGWELGWSLTEVCLDPETEEVAQADGYEASVHIQLAADGTDALTGTVEFAAAYAPGCGDQGEDVLLAATDALTATRAPS